MKKKLTALLLLSVMMMTLFLAGCEQPAFSAENNEAPKTSVPTQNSEATQIPESEPTKNIGSEEDDEDALDISQTGWTQAVPAEYMEPAAQQGTVVSLTYDSKDYVRDSSDIQKTAYVYLPCGYDEADTETRYDIFYLMHGMGGSAEGYFVGRNGNNSTKNMLDRMIENGEVPPMIIVSASFYTENSPRDFSGSIGELREFHQDFANDLMPAVEGQFHSYAQSTSEEDLIASRDHRAFGGFSLGSVTTWMQFCYNSDYIRYFLPMSGSCWYYGGYGDYYPEETCDFFEELIAEKNLNERGYFIYAATGTQDTVRDQVEIQMTEMLKRSDVFTPDHVVYYQKDGGRHDFEAVQEYIYNALPHFFRSESSN